VPSYPRHQRADFIKRRQHTVNAARSMQVRDLNIRAPDAINLVIAQRLGAPIATFAVGMARNAGVLGIAVTTL
jgi:phosphoribosylcarboxyaminoimidazole (NCAIR) mutase